MPKYVLKEDVEKGLVDPKLPLEEQPQYKKKIEQEREQKDKQLEKNAPKQRPKKERPPRKERPKFNWNKNDVTLETKAPEKPKKLLVKPDAEKHKQGFQKFKAERQALKAERQAIFDEQRAVIRDINQNKKYGREVNTQYSGVLKQKMGIQNTLRKEIRVADDQKKILYDEINRLRYTADELRRPQVLEGQALESLQNRVEQKEHQLTTSNIGKKDEARLTNQINEIKRAMSVARPYFEIESDINRIQDQINILFAQLVPIKNQLHFKIPQANAIKIEVQQLKDQRTTDKGPVQEHKSIEDIKADYDVKLKAIEVKRDKLQDRIDDYMDQHTRAKDQFEDQQDLLRYIDWVNDQIDRLKKKKLADEQWQKEKEEREKKRQKEKEDYEKRQEDKKKKQEEYKKKNQQYKAKLEKQKEDFINRNPNHETIDLCHALIDYCQSLKPLPVFEYDDHKVKPLAPGQITFGKEWQKQIKGGAQVVVSKKFKQDEQVTKKQPTKPKKNVQKAEDQNFEHRIETVNQFQDIKLLPPTNASEIDSTIKLINQKIELYSQVTEQEKAAFKEKAIKLWDEKRGGRDNKKQGTYREKGESGRAEQGGYREKKEDGNVDEEPRKEKKENNRRGKKNQLNENDFPELA